MTQPRKILWTLLSPKCNLQFQIEFPFSNSKTHSKFQNDLKIEGYQPNQLDFKGLEQLPLFYYFIIFLFLLYMQLPINY